MSVRLYVGNLPKEVIDRQELQAMFADIGESVTTKVIKDRKTGKCRGFAFVTLANDEMADEFIEKYNGQSFMESPLKIEKALPRAKSKGKEETTAKESKPESESTAAPSAPSKKRSNKKRDRNTNNDRSTNNDRDAVQPDPRWADELSKLKEMLAAQTSNS
ncbi:MAG: RNA recognition motif domain-containing protein [Prochloraceae cyanobacterium]